MAETQTDSNEAMRIVLHYHIMRDPRINPKPGDVLKVGFDQREILTRTTTLGRLGVRKIRLDQPGTLWEMHPTLSQWRKWAKDAEVVYAAE